MITFAQYKALLNERPRKFTPTQVGFRPAKQGEPMCAGCMHWYRGAVMDHDTCEIQRPDNEQVPYDWTCAFQTVDGEHFTLLKTPQGEQNTNHDTNNSNETEGAEDDAH